MSDYERYGWEPDGSRQEQPPATPPTPVETEDGGSTGLALLAGLVAAIAGGIAWGLISKYTDYEVGIVAWGIGFVVGFAVERAAGGRRSVDLQAIAIVSALLGVLIGKYLGFAFAVQEAEQGFGTQTGVLSGEMFSLFRENLSEVFGLFDLLWTALAVVSAWYALRPEEHEEAEPEAVAAPAAVSLPAAFPEPLEPPSEPAPPERRSRNPVDRLTHGLPHGWRVTIDWIVTIAGAIAIVLAIKAWVVNPYRIPSSSMEPTLHCARDASGCEARWSDRVLANRFIYRFRDPRRGEIVVFETPPAAQQRCGAGRHLRQAADRTARRARRAPQRRRLELRLHRRQEARRAVHPAQPARHPQRRDVQRARGAVLHDGRQPLPVVRLARVGDGPAQEPDRQGLCHLLAAEPHFRALSFRYHWPPVAGRPFAMSTIIESIEQRQLRKDIPRFKAGDTVRVHFQVIEGQRRRVQVFEGIVIKRQGSGARETFTVRKQSFGVGVERTFPVHSPKIEKIEVGAIGDVNRAKLYYLREKIGKKARVRELRQTPAQLAAARAESEANQAALDAAAAEAEAEAAAEAVEAEPEVEETVEAEPVAEAEVVTEAEDAPAEEPAAEAEPDVEDAADEPAADETSETDAPAAEKA